ncbi:helix-turn-helix transcriptional regulator [Bacillus thuringiensis]|uniref:helix-turn-helix domain-containing protein n=1 Tax=Bacillus thuringiensis TaxID=1428 RepID=UPI0010AD2D2A|nr:helix-turn-helix transcriptional regulator [Bacillus thuringiensis]TJZ99977.1 helix-turn-helix transcriptional regulator [Bacillus thuringiensis]
METIGEKIRKFRRLYQISQKELCQGICQTSYISLIENNKIKGKSETIQLILERIELFKSTTEIQKEDSPNANIGAFFLKERLKYKITQEKLCYGICSISYLSKMENNRIIPSLKIKKYLYERLEALKHKKGTEELEILELERLYDLMISLLAKKQMDAAKKLLKQGLDFTKNQYLKLYYLFVYQQYLYFDYKNLNRFLAETAIPFFNNQGDRKQLAIFYIDLAVWYQEEEQFEKACFYYQQGISHVGVVKNLNIISPNKKVLLQFS